VKLNFSTRTHVHVHSNKCTFEPLSAQVDVNNNTRKCVICMAALQVTDLTIINLIRHREEGSRKLSRWAEWENESEKEMRDGKWPVAVSRLQHQR
jgi:hypothetical protein